MRKVGIRLLLVFLSVLSCAFLLEGACSLSRSWEASGLPPVAREASHCEYDSELGWVHVPNRVVKNQYGIGIHLTTNEQRMRSLKEYRQKKSPDTLRIVCLGDSFTMGYGVGDRETYPAWIEKLQPGTETINMGLGGYGLGQLYLWYLRDGLQFETDILLCAVIGNDFSRMLPKGNVAIQPKPMLELIEGEPTAINLPVPFALASPSLVQRLEKTWKQTALGVWTKARAQAGEVKAAAEPIAAWEQPYVPVAQRVLERLREISAERGQRFVVAYLPTQAELYGRRPKLLDEWLGPFLEQSGIALIDLWPAFKTLTPAEIQVHYVLGHYSSLGNQLAAAEIIKGLSEL